MSGFQLNAGHFVLAFANTLDNRYSDAGPVELLATFDDFVRFCREAGLISAARIPDLSAGAKHRARNQAIELREALYALFRAAAREEAPPKQAIDVFNRFLAASAVPPALEWRKGRYAFRRPASDKSPNGLFAAISQAAAELLTSDAAQSVRECGEQTCRWLFLDQSKNHSRRWCDMKVCGNRAKARKFQERRR